MATKKGMTTNFSPLSFVAVFGSGMGKNQDSGIRDKYPGFATLLKSTVFYTSDSDVIMSCLSDCIAVWLATS